MAIVASKDFIFSGSYDGEIKVFCIKESSIIIELEIMPCGLGSRILDMSRVSNIESDNSHNIGLEDYNNISVRIFPYFTTPSIKITLG